VYGLNKKNTLGGSPAVFPIIIALSLKCLCYADHTMKTYQLFTSSSDGYAPLHTFQAASFDIADGVYIFYDDARDRLHAIAVAPGLSVKTAE
jgi:hypothetical protein